MEQKPRSLLQVKSFVKVWNIVLIICVAIVLILLVSEVFFPLPMYQSAIDGVSAGISVIFIIDVILLYLDKRDFVLFLKRDWPDIIAAIPFGQLFTLTKFIRVLRILRIIRLQKVSKVGKIYQKLRVTTKSIKILSKDSRLRKNQ